MSKANGQAASEDKVGKLHKAVTNAFQLKVDDMLDRHKNAEDEIDKRMALDTRDIMAAAKWVQMNEVTCAMPASDGKSALSKKLKAVTDIQSGKVIPFVAEG